MAKTAIVTFTARPLREILLEGGSRDWRLDARRARKMHYLVCTQNRHNADFGSPDAPHGAAFLVGRISGIVPSPTEADRWLIKIDEYTPCEIPNIWAKSGHLRYPIWYTTLEDLGIDLDALPPFRPVPVQPATSGLSEMPAPAFNTPANWMSTRTIPVAEHRLAPEKPEKLGGEQDTRRRMDAILAQLDRIPDLASPSDPLDWDEHGLPR
jgi:hypothetical protein